MTADPLPSPHPAGRPTGRDVARLAGVSQATVSLVFTSPDSSNRVSAATRAKVKAAARRLGYRPQRAGRHLRLGRAEMILLAVPDPLAPFFSRVLDGAQKEAATRGLAVVASGTADSTALDDLVDAGRFDGLLICSPEDGLTPGMPPQIAAVYLDADPARAADSPVIEFDFAPGMQQTVEHLRELGHHRIGRLCITHPSYTFRARQAAFTKAAIGFDVTSLAIPLSSGGTEARLAAHRLLSTPDRPTVVVCDDSVATAGVYQVAADLGLRIPDDLSVIGLDNGSLAALVTPPLTTIDLPGEELGRQGIQLLACLLHGTPPPPASTLVTSLKMRASTRAPHRHMPRR
ncbi:LacI family DNA-binding transcriptional regulator [Streptomyces sp. NPDC056835]|uniref:LacI family DNA-binding transcriptional regulator n=1 Tax=Streptomyces sp. NPDC056835 TaxID=3345956 RepID=UPI00368ABF49